MKQPILRGPKRQPPHRQSVGQEPLERFVRESNAIESIFRDPTKEEIAATREFIEAEVITVDSMIQLVSVYQPGARIRAQNGMDVRVGTYIAPRGGSEIVTDLKDLLIAVQTKKLSPFETYMNYETLHPFQDGNGRSGRALWAWRLLRSETPHWFEWGFYRSFHYQVFPAWRGMQRR